MNKHVKMEMGKTCLMVALLPQSCMTFAVSRSWLAKSPGKAHRCLYITCVMTEIWQSFSIQYQNVYGIKLEANYPLHICHLDFVTQSLDNIMFQCCLVKGCTIPMHGCTLWVASCVLSVK